MKTSVNEQSTQSPDTRNQRAGKRAQVAAVLTSALLGAASVGAGVATMVDRDPASRTVDPAVSGKTAAELSQPTASAMEIALHRAQELSQRLYSSESFKHGIPVHHVLNGTITMQRMNFQPVHFNNPVILALSETAGSPDASGNFLDGAWVAVPTANAQGRIELAPVYINLGGNLSDGLQSVTLSDPNSPVLDHAAIYPTASNGGDILMAFDPRGGDHFGSVVVSVDGSK